MSCCCQKQLFYGQRVSVLRDDKDSTLYQMEGCCGEGTMCAYHVFEGVDMIYNDFHMKSCHSAYLPSPELLSIDHCREGRVEWAYQNNYTYLTEGDLKIGMGGEAVSHFEFPLKHYHGITVAIDMTKVNGHLQELFSDFYVDLFYLKEKLKKQKNPFVMRAKDTIEHIFSELYNVKASMRIQYGRVKLMELLLFLTTLDLEEEREERPYYMKSQVDTIKAMATFMMENLDKHYTLNELSQKFGMSQTAMKNCFKGVYGSSIYAYMKAYRIQAAALMLRNTNEQVSTIAGHVGYDNPSKFASAFKEQMQVSPVVYRRNIDQMEL